MLLDETNYRDGTNDVQCKHRFIIIGMKLPCHHFINYHSNITFVFVELLYEINRLFKVNRHFKLC